jgi:hypothetical protein
MMTRLLFVISLAVFTLGAGKSSSDKDNYEVIMSTKFDFSETNIQGGIKAPNGFFLQGRQQQSLSEMVRLRDNFKRQLMNSQSAVRSLTR